MLKLRKHFVSNGTHKARITYSFNKDQNGAPFVTIRDKDYGYNLEKIFPRSEGYENETDGQTDYFEHGRVKLLPNHPLYKSALAFCEPRFLLEIAHEVNNRKKYGSSVDVILQSMAAELVAIFGWTQEEAQKLIANNQH